MPVISMKALLESGVHFGHRTNKWDPLMKPFIFTERNGIHIIDLQQTVKNLNTAYKLIVDTVSNGGVILFIGTKRQAQEIILEEAVRCGMPYVTERWLGGMLTNWVTIQQRIMELERLEKMHTSGDIERLTKKEGLLIDREIARLNIRLSGVRQMKRIPDLIFVVDVAREATAVHEAKLMGIPVIAMVDTNCDPRNVDYVIPSNDDAIRAIKLIVGKIADGVLEGMALRKERGAEEVVVEEKAVAAPAVRRGELELYEEELEDEALLGESTLAKLVQKLGEEDLGDIDLQKEEIIASLEKTTEKIKETYDDKRLGNRLDALNEKRQLMDAANEVMKLENKIDDAIKSMQTDLEKLKAQEEDKQEAYAVARILNLCDNSMVFETSYLLQAGICSKAIEEYVSNVISLPSSNLNIPIDITVFAEDMHVLPDNYGRIYYTRNIEQILSFGIIPEVCGEKRIIVTFYSERHWLTQITFDVNVVSK